MATENQLRQLTENLKDYKHKYLRKEFSKLDEADTRIMVNHFLHEILGYKELEEIRTEYRIRNEDAE